MFVTSDIHDLAEIVRSRRENWAWSEQLVGVVALHGAVWPGAEVALRLLQRAVDLCGLASDVSYANYRLSGQHRYRSAKPASLPKLVAKYGDRVSGVDIRGSRVAQGTRDGSVGVSVSVSMPLEAGMLCVVAAPELAGEKSRTLLAEAGQILGADYGYAFVRDDVAGPENYALGMGVALDYSELEGAELAESDAWAKSVFSNEWLAERFPLRDVFEVNLLTAAQLDRDLGGGLTLRAWIGDQERRGVLETTDDVRSVWSLDEAEMQSTRTELLRMGVIMSSLPRVYRGLSQSRGIALSHFAHSASRH